MQLREPRHWINLVSYVTLYVTLCAVLSPALNHLNYIPGIPCRPYAVAVTRARCIAGWRANYELLSEWIIVVVNGHHTAPARFRACRVMRRNIAPASLGGDGRDVSMCRMIFSRVRARSRAVTIIERIELYHVSNNHRDCKRIRMCTYVLIDHSPYALNDNALMIYWRVGKSRSIPWVPRIGPAGYVCSLADRRRAIALYIFPCFFSPLFSLHGCR